MSISTPVRLTTSIVCFGVIALLLSSTAVAKKSRKPEDVFKGDIVVSTKRFPREFKSDADFVKHMKSADTKVLYAGDSGGWSFEYMIFAKSPVGTLNATITYYDITDGAGTAVNTFTLYPRDEKDRIINGRSRLNKDGGFEPNKKYRMVFSRGYGQPSLAETDIVLYPAKGSTPETVSNDVEF